MSTNPEPGAKVLPDSTIQVVVSRGKERYEVPDVAGKSLDDARAALEKLNLQVGEVTKVYSEDVAKGDVVKLTSLKPGTPLKRDTEVDLTVSKGRQPIEVRSYVGQKADTATSGLQAAGLSPDVSYAFSDSVDKDVVIDQDPRDGTRYRGDAVKLVVSKGPEEVKVPDVRGQDLEPARKKLEDAGFKVTVRNVLPGSNKVVVQTPSSGKRKPGSEIVLYV